MTTSIQTGPSPGHRRVIYTRLFEPELSWRPGQWLPSNPTFARVSGSDADHLAAERAALPQNVEAGPVEFAASASGFKCRRCGRYQRPSTCTAPSLWWVSFGVARDCGECRHRMTSDAHAAGLGAARGDTTRAVRCRLFNRGTRTNASSA
jgi:hypothetical protein